MLPVDRPELVDAAQRLYNGEVDRRRLPLDPDEMQHQALDPDELASDTGPDPDWLEDAAKVFRSRSALQSQVAEETGRARAWLRKAGIDGSGMARLTHGLRPRSGNLHSSSGEHLAEPPGGALG